MKNRKGFTLVELLVVIIVLGLIAGIGIYFSSNVIEKAKEKTYMATKNNIEDVADDYITEYSNDIFYFQYGDIEYSCVTIQELIDYGYLKNDIVNSKYKDSYDNKVKNVSLNDYVYLERNFKTKVISNVEFLNDVASEDSKKEKCISSEILTNDIQFSEEKAENKKMLVLLIGLKINQLMQI